LFNVLMCYKVHDYVASLQLRYFSISEISATKMFYLTGWTYLLVA